MGSPHVHTTWPLAQEDQQGAAQSQVSAWNFTFHEGHTHGHLGAHTTNFITGYTTVLPRGPYWAARGA